MTEVKPGALAKALNASPAFALYSEPTGAIYDEDIYSVTIHRGKASRGGGVHPSTMEISVRGLHEATLSGDNIRFFMREVPAQRLAETLGKTGPEIDYRFQGRVGKIAVEDNGNGFDTTIYAASWIGRMNLAGRVTYPLDNQRIDTVFYNVLNLGTPPRGINMAFLGNYELLAGDQDPVNFSEASTKYGSDIGIYFRELRNGDTQVMTLPYRKTYADALAASQLPLTRSQAISPAGWAQANEYPAFKLNYKVTNTSGFVVTRTAEVETYESLSETVDEDWSYIRAENDGTSGQLYQEAYGRVYESSARMYSLPTITVDLLYLINSDKQYHRDQAGQLLAMETGDPIFLSGDWPTPVQGVHFAEAITETINGHEWKMELSLKRYSHALGMPVEPTIKPRVWDSASNKWDSDTNTWNHF